MNLSFTVSYSDGTKAEVKTRPASEVAFERQFDKTFSDMFRGQARYEWIYFLAHHASRTSTGFDDWLETISEVQWADDDAVTAVDPTEAAASTT